MLRFAAERARQEARLQLRRHVYANDTNVETAQFVFWCARIVHGFIADFIERHERDHDVFMERLGQAKHRDGSIQR